MGLSHREQLADGRCMVLVRNAPGAARSGFTLIEILIIVVILGILAGIVVTKYVDVRFNTEDAVLRTQLGTLRQQVQLYRTKTGREPKLVAKQWDELLTGNYIHAIPVNPLNNRSNVKGAPQPGAGWVWRPKPSGSGKQLYATDATSTGYFPE